MISAVLTFGAMLCCFAWGAGWATRRARARALADRRSHEALRSTVSRYATDNARLSYWCDQFRELYLGALDQINPALGREMRRRWSAILAPEQVRRLLERLRHG